ncbi:MAG: hypothetical protein AAF696_08525, partial [Bacteroidota bacterium]
RYQKAIGETTALYQKLNKAAKTVGRLLDFLKDREDSAATKVLASGKALQEKMMMLNGKMMAKPTGGITGDTDDLVAQLKAIGTYFFSSMVRPSEAQEQALARVEKQMTALSKEVNKFLDEDFASFQKEVSESKLALMSE